MIHFKSNIKNYNWIIDVYIILSTNDIQLLKPLLSKYPQYNEMLIRLTQFKNSGFSYSYNKKSLLVIGLQDSLLDFIDTLSHEKNHIETYIGNYYNLQYDSEEFSIMSGYIAKILFNDLLTKLIIITNKN